MQWFWPGNVRSKYNPRSDEICFVCPHCGGSGKVVGKRPPGVGPDGMAKKEETIKIKFLLV